MKPTIQQGGFPSQPMPYLIFSSFASSYFQLPNGTVQVVTKGERSQVISKAAFDRIEQTLNK